MDTVDGLLFAFGFIIGQILSTAAVTLFLEYRERKKAKRP